VSDILASILKENVDLEALPPIPATLRHVLERCLEKDPARRMRDVADLRLELEASRHETAKATAEYAGSGGTSWKLAVGIAVAASLASLAAGFAIWGGGSMVPEAHVIISSDSVSAGFQPLAISPDGRWIAETEIGSGIRLRAMNEIGWRDLPETANAASIAFSADSQRLYFTRGGGDEGSLYRIDVQGTAPVLEGTVGAGVGFVFRGADAQMVVSFAAFAGGPYSLHKLNSDGTFSELFAGESKGSAYYFTSQVSTSGWLGYETSGTSAVGLVFLDTTTGEVSGLLAEHRSPLYLGEGRILAVDARGVLISARIDPSSGAIVEPPAVQVEGLGLWIGLAAAFAVADDGTLVYLSGSGAAVEQLLAWLQPSGAIEPLTQRGGLYQIDSSVSPDGTRVAVEIRDEAGTSIAIHDIERDVRTALVPGAPIAFPVWSPDSKYIAYRLIEEGRSGIYRAPVDRSEAPELMLAAPEDGFALPTDWSSDNRYLLYVDSTHRSRQRGAAHNDLWLLPLDGADPRPFLATDAGEIDGRFSPDSRWVTYVSDQSGGDQIYVRALDGGGEFQISAAGGTSPEWSPAGGQLFFARGADIYVVDIDITGATPIVSPERVLVEWPSGLRPNLWAPAPDGKRFLVAQFKDSEGDQRSIRAIFNWDLLREWR